MTERISTRDIDSIEIKINGDKWLLISTDQRSKDNRIDGAELLNYLEDIKFGWKSTPDHMIEGWTAAIEDVMCRLDALGVVREKL